MAKVAVLGYGTVGSGVVEVLDTNANEVAKSAGEKIELKYILDLRDFPGDKHESQVVHDINIILDDPEVDVICETMGGIEPAFTFEKQALSKGKCVCTSNKELVAKHGAEDDEQGGQVVGDGLRHPQDEACDEDGEHSIIGA